MVIDTTLQFYSMQETITMLRSLRFHGVALFDYFGTVVCAFLITACTNIPLSLVTALLFVLSVPLHHIFKIETPTNTYLRNLF